MASNGDNRLFRVHLHFPRYDVLHGWKSQSYTIRSSGEAEIEEYCELLGRKPRSQACPELVEGPCQERSFDVYTSGVSMISPDRWRIISLVATVAWIMSHSLISMQGTVSTPAPDEALRVLSTGAPALTSCTGLHAYPSKRLVLPLAGEQRFSLEPLLPPPGDVDVEIDMIGRDVDTEVIGGGDDVRLSLIFVIGGRGRPDASF